MAGCGRKEGGQCMNKRADAKDLCVYKIESIETTIAFFLVV